MTLEDPARPAGPGECSTGRDKVREEIRRLAPWFHNLRLAGEETAPDHFLGDYPRFKWERFAGAVPADLSGRTVLDIGCNAGFYALEMKRRGAERVVGIDSDPRYLEQARLASDLAGLPIELRRMSVYDVAALAERFDLVVFMGVFYHLRHPLLALDLIREHVAGDMLLFQSLQRGSDEIFEVPEDQDFECRSSFDEPGYPRMHFVEHRYAGDPTNWWIPNAAASAAILRSAGFRIEAHPEQEVYLCRLGERPYGAELPAIFGRGLRGSR